MIYVSFYQNTQLYWHNVTLDDISFEVCTPSFEIEEEYLTWDCTDVGETTVTLTVTDVNGNTSSCESIVTVEDNVDPEAICQDITVELDENGEAVLTAADIDGGSTDACGIESLSIDDEDWSCDDIGENIVTLTVTDVNGNVSTCENFKKILPS